MFSTPSFPTPSQAMIHWLGILAALWLATAQAVFAQAVFAQAAPTAPGELKFAVPRPLTETPQVWIPTSRFTSGPHVRYAFREVVRDTISKTVRVRSAGKDVALGGIVGADGWILTKASCLGDQLSCQFSGGRELDARIVGINRHHDLAMLKVSAKRLPILELNHGPSLEVGHWVATVSTDPLPVTVGVVSVMQREIPQRPGILGIRLDDSEIGPRVVQIFANTGAANAGIQVNDVIVSINGNPTTDRRAIQRQIRQHSPGDQLEVELERGTRVLTVLATLTGQLSELGVSRRQFQNGLGGKLSQRRFGFPAVFQHDAILRPADCGGPLVNLDGKVVGINIARAGRTESYAIPSAVLVPLLYELMSGNLAP